MKHVSGLRRHWPSIASARSTTPGERPVDDTRRAPGRRHQASRR
jgi:hypothetical protein